jgi:hypothetical protein
LVPCQLTKRPHFAHKTGLANQSHTSSIMSEEPKKHSNKRDKKKSKDVEKVVAVDDIDDEIRKEERRRKKLLRQAKQQAKLFAELGLDENGNPLDNFSLLKYPVREWIVTLPGMNDAIALNPVVTLIGVVLLWGLVVWTTGTT